MRAPALLLPLLVALLACKSDSAEDTGGSSTGNASCSGDNIGDMDPNYPACGCSPDFCAEGSSCRFTGPSQPEWIASVCLPECTLGPSCGNPDLPCKDSSCPALAGITATCLGGLCYVYCDDASPCPSGYLCGESGYCQVEL